MVQLINRHIETVRREPFQYNHPFAMDRNGMKNPYMRPDRRVRPNHVKWWFHGYIPVYGRVIQRLSPNEIHVVRPLLWDLQHKIQHNLGKYGPVVIVSATFIYSYIGLTEKWTIEGFRSLRF